MRTIPASVIQKLDTLGLTKQEARIYLLCLHSPPLTAKTISNELKILIPSVHRSLKALRTHGLIQTYGTRPIRVRAIEPAFALSKLVETTHQHNIKLQNELVEELKIIKSAKKELYIEFLQSKDEIFAHAIPCINNAKKNISILSIGEEIPEEVFFSITQAAKRGVKVYMLAETYSQKNKELLSNWKKNGWNVRYLKDITIDFTLTLYDSQIAVVQIRKTKETDHRIGIAFHNPGYTKAQQSYFDNLWKQAVECR